jgi:hypothetical protein
VFSIDSSQTLNGAVHQWRDEAISGAHLPLGIRISESEWRLACRTSLSDCLVSADLCLGPRLGQASADHPASSFTGEKMRYKKWLPIIAASGAILGVASARAAVSQDSFLLNNTGALVDLCSAQQNDPLYTAAVHFCQGFTVGVFRVLRDVDEPARSQHLFCLPNPPPSCTDAMKSFVRWATADPNRLHPD